MYFARQEAPDPATSALRSLRPSLNTPVVVVEELPTGPASAAIACLRDPAGSRVVLAIRSERSGQAIFFGPDEELRDWQGPAEVAIDAALSFAESMGFLFEDDRLAVAPGEAQQLWRDLLDACSRARGPLAERPIRDAAAVPEQAAAAAGPDGEELWLDEIAPAVRAVSHALPLTKFRRAQGVAPRRPAEGTKASATGRPLGRFQVGPARRG